MLGKLLLRWKLKKLRDEQEDVFRRAELQACLPPIEEEIGSRRLRKINVDVFTDDANRLIDNLTIAEEVIRQGSYLPRFNGLSLTKGTKPLSEWLTSSEGYSIHAPTVDKELQRLLTVLARELNKYETEKRGDNLKYYQRKLNTLIIEALRIRLQLHDMES